MTSPLSYSVLYLPSLLLPLIDFPLPLLYHLFYFHYITQFFLLIFLLLVQTKIDCNLLRHLYLTTTFSPLINRMIPICPIILLILTIYPSPHTVSTYTVDPSLINCLDYIGHLPHYFTIKYNLFISLYMFHTPLKTLILPIPLSLEL